MDIKKEFLKEYEKLCQKYGMGLRGCGCCNSPWLELSEEKNTYEICDVNYDSKKRIITIGYYEKTIDEYFEEVKG
jgi:hypothetical protein